MKKSLNVRIELQRRSTNAVQGQCLKFMAFRDRFETTRSLADKWLLAQSHPALYEVPLRVQVSRHYR